MIAFPNFRINEMSCKLGKDFFNCLALAASNLLKPRFEYGTNAGLSVATKPERASTLPKARPAWLVSCRLAGRPASVRHQHSYMHLHVFSTLRSADNESDNDQSRGRVYANSYPIFRPWPAVSRPNQACERVHRLMCSTVQKPNMHLCCPIVPCPARPCSCGKY